MERISANLTLKPLAVVCSSYGSKVLRASRVFYCTLAGRNIVILHSFVKKSQKTPVNERRIAEVRMKEIKK